MKLHLQEFVVTALDAYVPRNYEITCFIHKIYSLEDVYSSILFKRPVTTASQCRTLVICDSLFMSDCLLSVVVAILLTITDIGVIVVLNLVLSLSSTADREVDSFLAKRKTAC